MFEDAELSEDGEGDDVRISDSWSRGFLERGVLIIFFQCGL